MALKLLETEPVRMPDLQTFISKPGFASTYA